MAWIYHNAELGLISLSSDGESWITIADKNLWATTVYNDGDTLSEANCGKYYQRGNNYGFPFTWSVTTSNSSTSAWSYWPWNYYSSSTFITAQPRDANKNNNLWWWTTWTNAAMQWPCPSGYHVPTQTERQSLQDLWVSIGALSLSNWTSFKIYLKMPFAGRRVYSSGNTANQDTYGYYWSSMVTSVFNGIAYVLAASSAYIETYEAVSDWHSIRAFKNEPVVPDYNDTWTTLYWDELPDRPTPPLPQLKYFAFWWNKYWIWNIEL